MHVMWIDMYWYAWHTLFSGLISCWCYTKEFGVACIPNVNDLSSMLTYIWYSLVAIKQSVSYIPIFHRWRLRGVLVDISSIHLLAFSFLL